MSIAIEARGLGRDFGEVRALDQIQFEAHKGQCMGIVGSRGSGKTTLLRLIAGMIQPTRGELFVLGLNSQTNGVSLRSQIGFMPEVDGFDEDLTVLQTLVLFGTYFGIAKDELTSRARHLLRVIQLDEAEMKLVLELNPGQRLRLNLARALINRPQLLLIDASTDRLTESEREWFWRNVRQECERGLTTLIASQNLDEVERLCDRVIILDRGRAACQGEPENLVNQHIGRHVIEYDVPIEDLEYHLQAINGKYQFQIVNDRLKVFLPESVDTSAAIRWVPSEKVVYRRAHLKDVYSKIMGRDLT